MFANGQGVPQNYQKAYVWYSISVAQGRANVELREEAVSKRDKAAADLTPEDLSKAQALASRCFESNFKDCD
jgi:TPR repeat protein